MQAACNFENGAHRPWSLPNLHTHVSADLRRDPVALTRSRARRRARRAAADGVTVDGAGAPRRVGMRASALRSLLRDRGAPPPARERLSTLLASEPDDPYASCVGAALNCESEVGADLTKSLDRADRRRTATKAPWADENGRYRNSREAAGLYAYVEAPAPIRGGAVDGRPGWDQSFYTPNVATSAKYRATVRQRPAIVGARVEPDAGENAHAATDAEAVRRSKPYYRLETGSTGTDAWGNGPERVVAALSPRSAATGKLLREAISTERTKDAARAEHDARRRIEALYEAIPKSAGGMKPISRRRTEYGLYEAPTSPKRSGTAGRSPGSRGDSEIPPSPPALAAPAPPLPEARAPDRPRLFP